MQGFGYFLVFVAAVAALVGFLQHRKGKKILAAPFKRTGEIASNPGVADAKGFISCEGAIEAPQPVFAPCSGTPCVYYEVEVVQEWEKHVNTEDGHKVEKGKTTIQNAKGGTIFNVNDGSGPVAVDPREGLSVELDKTFEQAQNVSYGDVIFGQFQAHVPHAGGDKHGRSVKVVEKIVPVQGRMFINGQLTNQMISKPKGMLGSLHGSRKGRAALLGATKRNSKIGLIAAAACFVPGLAMAIFADPPAPRVAGDDACNILDESKPDQPCTGKIRDDDGVDVKLTVTKPGTFEVHGGPPAGKKIPVMASLTVKSEDGKALLTNATEDGTVDLAPGKYTINIKDSVPGDAAHFKGGFSFELAVKRTAVAAEVAVTAASASAAPHPAASAAPDKAGKPTATVKDAHPKSAAENAAAKPAASTAKK